LKMHMHIPHSQYIFDEMIFNNIIRDINFFSSIRLIEQEEIQIIKKELVQLIDFMEELATLGKYKDTGNEVSFYISGVAIDTNHSCLEATGYHISLVRTLILNGAATTDESTFSHIKQWFLSLKRISTLISLSGEKQRINFFKKQREMVASL